MGTLMTVVRALRHVWCDSPLHGYLIGPAPWVRSQFPWEHCKLRAPERPTDSPFSLSLTLGLYQGMASLFCWGGNCHFLFVFMHSFMGEFGDSGSCDFSISRVLPTRSVILLLRQNSTLSNQADLSFHKAVLLMMMFNKWLLFLSSFRVFSTSSSQDLTSCWTFKCDKPFRFKCPGWSPSDKKEKGVYFDMLFCPKAYKMGSEREGLSLAGK